MEISAYLRSYTWPVKDNVFHDPPLIIKGWGEGGLLRDSPPFICGRGMEGGQWMALIRHSRCSEGLHSHMQNR